MKHALKKIYRVKLKKKMCIIKLFPLCWNVMLADDNNFYNFMHEV